MLDFSDTGELGLMVSEQAVAAREATIGHGGLLRAANWPGLLAALRANDLIWPYVVNGYLKGRRRPPSTCCSGTATTPTCRGRCTAGTCATPTSRTSCASRAARCSAACRWIWGRSRCPPSFTPRARTTSCPGRPPTPAPSCSAVTCASCSVPAATSPGHQPAGQGQAQLWVGKLAADADRWLERAEDVPGGWWPAWMDWLGEHAGRLVAAPKSAGSRQHKPIESAPGRYVRPSALTDGTRPAPQPRRRNHPCKTSSSSRGAHRGRQVRRLDRQHPGH